MALVNFRINATGADSLRASITFTTHASTELTDPEHMEPADEMINIKNRALELWSQAQSAATAKAIAAQAWMRTLNDEKIDALAQQVTDSAHVAYMKLAAHKAIAAQAATERTAKLADVAAERTSKLADVAAEHTAAFAERTAVFADDLAAKKAALADVAAERTAAFAERTAVFADDLAAKKTALADVAAERTAALADGLAAKKTALGEITNRAATRTQELAQTGKQRLAAHKTKLAESQAAQAASRLLGDASLALDEAVETSAAVVQTTGTLELVRVVGEKAGAVKSTVSTWANAAIAEGRDFINIQSF